MIFVPFSAAACIQSSFSVRKPIPAHAVAAVRWLFARFLFSLSVRAASHLGCDAEVRAHYGACMRLLFWTRACKQSIHALAVLASRLPLTTPFSYLAASFLRTVLHSRIHFTTLPYLLCLTHLSAPPLRSSHLLFLCTHSTSSHSFYHIVPSSGRGGSTSRARWSACCGES